MYVVFLGAPGAGKGTQASRVAEELKLVYIATGDLLRQALEQGSELGKQAKPYMERGVLVSDKIVIGMVLERVFSPSGLSSGAVFDGFPRNLKQAKALDKAIDERGKAIDRVVYIRVSEKELLERLSGRWICRQCQSSYHVVNSPPKVWGRCDQCGGELYQRPDDTEEVIKKRLEVYFRETAPLINYYSREGKLVEIDGEGSVAAVTGRIIGALG